MVPSPSDVTRIRYVATLAIRLFAVWQFSRDVLGLLWYVWNWLFEDDAWSLATTRFSSSPWLPTLLYMSVQIAAWFIVFWCAPKIARFFVHMPGGVACPTCGYDVTSSGERTCPECGLALDERFRSKDAS